MKLQYIGHATFRIFSDNFDIIIDPYFTQEEFRLIPPAVDYRLLRPTHVLITHEHFDHCDAVAVNFWVRRYGSKIIAPMPVERKLMLKVIKVKPNHRLDFGDFELIVTKAIHPQAEAPVGYILDFDGFRIYHAGDTYFDESFEDISTDIALLPIGGKYTMNVEEAGKMARLIHPKLVIPMHYNTFAEIRADPRELVNYFGRVLILEPGEVIDVGNS